MSKSKYHIGAYLRDAGESKGEHIDLNEFITDFIHREQAEAGGVTAYRTPQVGFALAADPRFRDLQRIVEPTHFLPEEMLPGARTVISFFLPFATWVIEANARDRYRVAREWPVAYLETNALIGRITGRLIKALADLGVRAAAAPATHNYDRTKPAAHLRRTERGAVQVSPTISTVGDKAGFSHWLEPNFSGQCS